MLNNLGSAYEMLTTVQPFGVRRCVLHRFRYAVTVLRRLVPGRWFDQGREGDKPRGAAFTCAVGLDVIRFRVGLAIVPLRLAILPHRQSVAGF